MKGAKDKSSGEVASMQLKISSLESDIKNKIVYSTFFMKELEFIFFEKKQKKMAFLFTKIR